MTCRSASDQIEPGKNEPAEERGRAGLWAVAWAVVLVAVPLGLVCNFLIR